SRRPRPRTTNVRPSSVLVSLALHACALASLLTTTLLPQGPPFIEVFQAEDPLARLSSFDEGAPSRASAGRTQVTAPRVEPRVANPAAGRSTARGDAAQKPRTLPLV